MFLVLEHSILICVERDIYHDNREEVMYDLHRTSVSSHLCALLGARRITEGVASVVGTAAQKCISSEAGGG